MSEAAKAARAANKAKAKRMSDGEPRGRIDASDWSPPEMLNTEAKTGMRPVSRRAFKKGGKVVAMLGEKSHKNAGRKARKDGGKVANAIVNRNVKDANAEAFGKPHIGGYKKGGAAHKDEKQDRKLVKKMVKPGARTGKSLGGVLEDIASHSSPAVMIGKAVLGGKKKTDDDMEKKRGGAAKGNYTGGTRPTGGRIARKDGGRTKGKTNINIIIGGGAGGGAGQQPQMQPPGQMGPVRPPAVPVPPPMPPQAAPMPGAGAGLPPPPMARKSGGRVGNKRYRSFKDMDAGAGGGLGRLEKTEIQSKR